jgi:hypothetical protein
VREAANGETSEGPVEVVARVTVDIVEPGVARSVFVDELDVATAVVARETDLAGGGPQAARKRAPTIAITVHVPRRMGSSQMRISG